MKPMESSSELYRWERYKDGDYHVSMEEFTSVRDMAELLAGSIRYWLERQPPEKHDELSDTFAGLWIEYEIIHAGDMTMECFSRAVPLDSIFYTTTEDEGSFCVNAAMAYMAYQSLLKEVVRKFDIPIATQEMPLSYRFDSWLKDGYYKATAEDIATAEAEWTPPSGNVSEIIAELFRKAREHEPAVDAFRVKVTSCCEVCSMLDEACRG